MNGGSALKFTVLAECQVTKARVAKMDLPHQCVDTPVFMPVGTQGTMKGLTSQQLIEMDCQIILGNTYHLGNRPVISSCHEEWSFLNNALPLFIRVVKSWEKLVDFTALWVGIEHC